MKKLILLLTLVLTLTAATLPSFSTPAKAGPDCDAIGQACLAVAEINYAICRAYHGPLWCQNAFTQERAECNTSQGCPWNAQLFRNKNDSMQFAFLKF